MSRDLCVRLIDIGEGLERNVPVSIMFIANLFPYAEMSKLDYNTHTHYFPMIVCMLGCDGKIYLIFYRRFHA